MNQDGRKAFENMVNQYSERVYWQIRRMVYSHEDANDLVQNTFLKAWKSWDSFRNESQLSTWLFRIAVNETLDFLRHRKVRNEVDVDPEVGAAQTTAQQLLADDYFDGDATQALLQEAISSLPDVQRQVFTLRYYEEMSYKDMSVMLATSEGALKASYHHAVKKIEKYFKDHH